MDFLKFIGDDFKGWRYRVNQFFEVNESPEVVKLKLVAIHLKENALKWHQGFVNAWRDNLFSLIGESFIKAMSFRFGVDDYDDPIGETGSLHSYLNEFDTLLNKVDLSVLAAVSFFLGD